MSLQSLARMALPLAYSFMLSACGGNSSSSERDLTLGGLACPDLYDPVCALTQEDAEFQYQTFSNSCYASRDGANVVFGSRCGALENEVSGASQAIIVHESIDQLPEASSDITVLDSEITGDVATLTIEHGGGCGEHRFDLHVAPPFMESWPLQIHGRLTHETDDTCLAAITTAVNIDLLPLKNLYRTSYGDEPGEIMIPQVGLYQF